MQRMALIFAIALTLTASFAPAASAGAADLPADDAPVCSGYVGVRCADGGQFCWVYVRSNLCLSTSG